MSALVYLIIWTIFFWLSGITFLCVLAWICKKLLPLNNVFVRRYLFNLVICQFLKQLYSTVLSLTICVNNISILFFCLPTGRWWMAGLLSASTPSSHLPLKTILYTSEPTNFPQTQHPRLPPAFFRPPSASWTTVALPWPQTLVWPPSHRLARSRHPSLTAHSDPSWLKTRRALWRFWVRQTTKLSLSGGVQWWVSVVSVGEVVAAALTAAQGCWSWWRTCQVTWMWQHSAIRSFSTSMSWWPRTATRCSW